MADFVYLLETSLESYRTATTNMCWTFLILTGSQGDIEDTSISPRDLWDPCVGNCPISKPRLSTRYKFFCRKFSYRQRINYCRFITESCSLRRRKMVI